MSQALALQKYFKDINIDTVYTSPLKRAIITAHTMFTGKDINIQNSKAFAERSFGVWEGLSYEEIFNKYPDSCKSWENDWIDYKMTDGESYREFYTRVTTFITKKLVSIHGETICIVSHSGVICTIISCLLNMELKDIWRFKVDKGSVSQLILDNSGYAYLNKLNIIP
jgi:broad specificity phosphatase PhoE